MDDRDVEETLLRLTRERGAGKTICPTEAAKALAGSSDNWQTHLPAVRRVAIRLAREGKAVITRKGKPVDPDDFRGVYRIGAP